MPRIILLVFLILCAIPFVQADESFILLNSKTNEIITEFGSSTEERVTPSSTFKIALSLMGYDAGILKDEKNPTIEFQEGFDDIIESWKQSQNPATWINRSCVWYSKIISQHLGLKTIERYLSIFEYGNQDLSEGIVPPGPSKPLWISSSLKISPKEQVKFIHKMVLQKLPISIDALQMTKKLLFKEESDGSVKLYGKGGLGTKIEFSGKKLKVRWFVGWIEKEQNYFPFAYLLQEPEVDVHQTIPRVKLLIEESIRRI